MALSRCTRGYPDVAGDQLFAAISPDLRWLGDRVKVCRVDNGLCVTVAVIDCDCQATRGIDLYADAFAHLGPLTSGRIAVAIWP